MINDDDWACFLDADAMFTTSDYHEQLETITTAIDSKNLNVGLLTAVTNRIGNVEQIVFSKDSDDAYNHDFSFHRKIGKNLQEKNRYLLKECKDPISGVVLLLPKRVWKQTEGFINGFLSVDNHIDYAIRRAGFRTCIMEGLYVYHWYRNDWKETNGLAPTGYK